MGNTSAETVIDAMSERFTSGNSIQVERAYVTRKEWQAVLERFREVANEVHVAAKNAGCARCRLAGSIAVALEKLT